MKATIPQPRAISSTIDIEVDGIQHGYLSLPHPSERSPLGTQQIPVCVIRNGEGPTVALLAGSRSDEYEGQIALHNLIESINLKEVSGCIIIVPSMNLSSSMQGSHFSTIDGKDLDRCFPGDASGSHSDQLAQHLCSTLINPSDVVIEVQSGGSAMMFTSLAAVHFDNEHASLQQASEACMIAFGAPYSARLLPAEPGSLAHYAASKDKVFLAVRLGGGGSAAASSLQVAAIGFRNALIQSGVLQGEMELRATRMLEFASEKNMVFAPCNGLLQLSKDPGDDVYMGNPIAKVIQPGDTGTPARIITANRNGILMARHHSAVVEQGDCIAIVADEVPQ